MVEFMQRAARVFTEVSEQIEDCWEAHMWDDAMESYAKRIIGHTQYHNAEPDEAKLREMAQDAIKGA
jgi:hypothetical protein